MTTIHDFDRIERDRYRDSLRQIEAILRTPEWSVGMLEDIKQIIIESGVVHPNSPIYYHH